MFPMLANTSQIVMFEVAEGIEVETDKDCDNLGVRHHPLSMSFGASGVDGSPFFAISGSNSLQKSSAIQKISITLLSVIMIQYLLFTPLNY